MWALFKRPEKGIIIQKCGQHFDAPALMSNRDSVNFILSQLEIIPSTNEYEMCH